MAMTTDAVERGHSSGVRTVGGAGWRTQCETKIEVETVAQALKAANELRNERFLLRCTKENVGND